MTPRRFKCTRLRKGILDYKLECITLLQNDFCKQRHITLNVTIPGQDRIDPNTYLFRTFFTGYTFRSFYKCQDELIKSFESIRYETEEDKIDMTKLRKTVSKYAKLTFFANLVSVPRHRRTCLRGFRPGQTLIGLCSHKRWLKTLNFGFR